MCTHSIDDLLPHAPLHCAATGEMVKGSYYYNIWNTMHIYDVIIIITSSPIIIICFHYNLDCLGYRTHKSKLWMNAILVDL